MGKGKGKVDRMKGGVTNGKMGETGEMGEIAGMVGTEGTEGTTERQSFQPMVDPENPAHDKIAPKAKVKVKIKADPINQPVQALLAELLVAPADVQVQVERAKDQANLEEQGKAITTPPHSGSPTLALPVDNTSNR